MSFEIGNEKNADKECLIRWREITRTQLGYTINLILSFSVATIGFQVTLLVNPSVSWVYWSKCLFSVSIILLLLAIIAGISTVFCRLKSFRQTAIIVRDHGKNNQEQKVEDLRKQNECLDRNTWRFFYCQMAFFGVGILLCASSFANRLF